MHAKRQVWHGQLTYALHKLLHLWELACNRHLWELACNSTSARYRIRPNYRTVHLGFFFFFFFFKYSYSENLWNIILPILHFKERKKKKKKKKKKDQRNNSSNYAYAMFLCVCMFLSDFFVKAYVVGTHLNCIDKSMQFKWVPTTYPFIKK